MKTILIVLAVLPTLSAQFAVLDPKPPTKAEAQALAAKLAKMSCEQQADFWAPFAKHPVTVPHVELNGIGAEAAGRIAIIEMRAGFDAQHQQLSDQIMWDAAYSCCQAEKQRAVLRAAWRAKEAK